MSPKGTASLLLNYAKDRAKTGGLPYDLDRAWLAPKLLTGVCEVSGVRLIREMPEGYRFHHPYAPSIDRVVPALGYLKSNCRLVCFLVNRAKSNYTDEVLLEIARGIVAVANVKGITG